MRIAAELVALKEWEKLVATSSGLGHRLGPVEQDTDVSMVAECIGCGELFAVDGQERPYQYGSALSVVCTGRSGVIEYPSLGGQSDPARHAPEEYGVL